MLIIDLSVQAEEFLEIIKFPIIASHNRHKASLKKFVKWYLKFKLINPMVVTVKGFKILLEGNNLPVFALKIFEHYHASPLLEAIEKNPEDLEVLVKQFLWINTSMGNWSYVLRALELKVKLAGKEKGDLNYEEMLNSLELAS